MDKYKTTIIVLSLVCIAIAFFILLEQYITWDKWWETDQFIHHENFAAVFIAFGAGLLVTLLLYKNACRESKRTKQKKKKRK